MINGLTMPPTHGDNPQLGQAVEHHLYGQGGQQDAQQFLQDQDPYP